MQTLQMENAMKCIKCGHGMEPAVPLTLSAEVRGELFTVQVVAAKCAHCDRVLLNSKARRMYHRAGADGYRQQHDLLTASEIDHLRRNLGMTWKQFAEYTNIGIATLKRWMGGEIQTPSLDSLVRLKADPSFAQRALEELLARAVLDSPNVQAVAPAMHRRSINRSVNLVRFDPAGAEASTNYEFAA